MFGFGEKPYILHIDDEPSIRFLIVDLLEHLGYSCVSTPSAKEGLQQARKQTPILVMIDAMMPEVDGYSTCRELRADPKFKDVPIIMLTALDRMDQVERAFSAGANDYLIKPLDMARLKAKLAKVLGPKL